MKREIVLILSCLLLPATLTRAVSISLASEEARDGRGGPESYRGTAAALQAKGAAGSLVMDVFLLGGQSNAGGRGGVAEISDPSILLNASVMLYHSTQLVSGEPALTWTTLRPASNSAGFFGPEIGFGNRMAALYPDRRIAIIKHAVGGTDLGANWNPGIDAGDTAHFGPHFQTFVETVNLGIDDLKAQGYTPVVRGMLWQQGERDARDASYGSAYARNLSHFIERVREQFGAPNMPFVYGQVLPVVLAGYDHRGEVRQGQLDVDQDSGTVHATDGARLVLTDDLGMNADNLHINAAGQIELGTRFADAIGSVVVTGAFDFDGDGKIGCADVCAMLDHWHEDEPAYDVVPLLFGDGLVDVQDLTALVEFLGKDLRLLAHWPLDEEDGSIARDRAKGSDGTLWGEPRWQPHGGLVDGALGLDGIDDYVNTPLVRSPSDEPFTIFVWVTGGEPGQVAVSQADGTNWLMLHPEDGAVMTELKGAGRGGGILTSHASISDGNWHQLGLLWDGLNRVLYVDGIEAARDTQATMEAASGGIRIGAGKDLQAGSFWAGLIDDIRMYDRPVRPEEQ